MNADGRGRTPGPADPSKAYNKAHNGRASRRQANWERNNKPRFGPIKSTWAACPKCFMIKSACECDRD